MGFYRRSSTYGRSSYVVSGVMSRPGGLFLVVSVFFFDLEDMNLMLTIQPGQQKLRPRRLKNKNLIRFRTEM
jgi:hypothetical protein